MKRPVRAIALAAAVAAFTAGCAPWVETTEEGAAVRVARADEVEGCERLGRTTSKVADEILFVDRSEKTMTAELASLAQNEAAAMGGDTIVPTSPIEDGRQTFAIYRCGS